MATRPDRSRGCNALAALIILALLYCRFAGAMMAGTLPDTPAARVDPNTTSSPWNGVGSVVVSGAAYSGVVVAPRFVLTASHVVGSTSPAAIQFVLNFGGNQTHTIPAQAVFRYPSASFPYDDLALVELTVAVPNGVNIYPLFREPLNSTQRITLVGYGASGNGDVGVSAAASRSVKRVGENIVDAVQATVDASGRSSLFYLYDFDGPSGSGVFGGPTLGNAVETLVAGGDSGSPAFIGGALMGINTFVAQPVAGQPNDYKFGMFGGGMLLSRAEFLNWIDATTGYTASADAVDIPTLPQWALIAGTLLLGSIALGAQPPRRRA